MQTTPMHEFLSRTFLNLFLLDVHQLDAVTFTAAMKEAQGQYYEALRAQEKEEA